MGSHPTVRCSSPMKVTFSMRLDVVPVRIRGEGGGFPNMPDAGDLLARFHTWCVDEQL